MTRTPDEIFAWLDCPKSKDDPPKGGWNTDGNMKNIRYVRSDLAIKAASTRVEVILEVTNAIRNRMKAMDAHGGFGGHYRSHYEAVLNDLRDLLLAQPPHE
jgi:hypothetical protein